MLPILLAGIFLGGLSVFFALENVSDVTVNVLIWQLTAPLATILLTTIFAGALMVSVGLLPGLLRDERRFKRVLAEKKALEDELSKYQITIPIAPPGGVAFESLVQHHKKTAA